MRLTDDEINKIKQDVYERQRVKPRKKRVKVKPIPLFLKDKLPVPTREKWVMDTFHPLRISATHVLWFHANQCYWEKELENGTKLVSKIYQSRATAEWVFHNNRITWL